MALVAGEFKSGGRVVDRFGRDSLKTETAGSALTAGDYKSGGVVRDADGRIVVVVETLNAAVTAGSVKSGGRLFDDKGRLIVAVSAAALTSGEVLSGGEITDAQGRVVVSSETLDAAYSAGDYNTGGGARSSLGRRLVAGAGAAFDPSSIAGLSAWFKADAGTSTTTDGVAISQWNDQSSGAHNATQATGANQPLYKTAIQNSLPAVLFDGSNDSLDATGVVIAAQPTTSFVAAKSLVTTTGHNMIDGITVRQGIGLGGTGGLNWSLEAGSDVESTTAGDLLAHTFSVIFNGASTAFFKDGSALTIGNPGTNGLNGLRIGSFNNGVVGNWNGYIFEVLVYSGSLSVADRQSVEGYLKSKWGTP